MNTKIYVSKITTYNWDNSEGLGEDVRQVLQFYDNQELNELCKELVEDKKPTESHYGFHSDVRKIIRKLDFANCKKKLQDSALRGSQATRIFKVIVSNKSAGLPHQLSVQVPRYCVPTYIQILCGCDFLTPFSPTKTPDCKFCNEKKISWTHLLFECPNITFNRHKIISLLHKALNPNGKDYSEVLTTKSIEARRFISKMWSTKNFENLFLLCLGILQDFGLGYKHLIHDILGTTIPLFYRIQNDWEMM